MKLVFATHNQHKYDEVVPLMPDFIELVNLKTIGCFDEIPETGSTLEENARIKADYVTENYGLPCFSDDTGLLVDALNGAPGVYSARYAGEEKNANANMDKLLLALKGQSSRKARFETVIVLNLPTTSKVFRGQVAGEITHEKSGTLGFGYDPIFKPLGYNKTFAEIPLADKNTMSHRGRAMKQLLAFLNTLAAS